MQQKWAMVLYHSFSFSLDFIIDEGMENHKVLRIIAGNFAEMQSPLYIIGSIKWMSFLRMILPG